MPPKKAKAKAEPKAKPKAKAKAEPKVKTNREKELERQLISAKREMHKARATVRQRDNSMRIAADSLERLVKQIRRGTTRGLEEHATMVANIRWEIQQELEGLGMDPPHAYLSASEKAVLVARRLARRGEKHQPKGPAAAPESPSSFFPDESPEHIPEHDSQGH